MSNSITASMLYDLVQCPHRSYLDVHGDPSEKDSVSPFVQLLWDRGHAFEKEVIERLEEPFTDLSPHSPEQRESLTVTNCANKPMLQELVKDPARLEWHEV
ncbi:unnamed protein product, partial [marine sediment metagenome]